MPELPAFLIWGLIGLGGVILVGAVVLVLVGLRSQSQDDPLQERLGEFLEKGEQVSLEEIELSQSFSERIILPIARGLGNLAIKFTPQNAILQTQKKLERAGNPSGLEPGTFMIFRIVAAVGMSAIFIFLGAIAPPGSIMEGRGLLVGIPIGLLGFYLPEMWLTSQVERRQKNIRKAMPDALDLLTICVEAGLGFDAAMSKVNEKWDNELALAFGRAIREIQLGKLRREALRDMADRLGLPELTSFVAAVIQSEQLGVSMAKVLRIQSDQMRIRRRQLAEEEAHKAPIKMLFPMAVLIFPSIMIILLGPSALLLLTSPLGQMFFP